MDPLTQNLDAALSEIASRQKGVVTRQQLLAVGFSWTVIRRRVRSGGLIPIHQGVYLVGHRAVDPLAYETAALLACRPRAVLSHQTAARLWKLPVPDGGPIHVTVVARTRRSLRGVRVHSLKELSRAELRRRHGLPLTSPSLTVLDLAGTTDVDEFAAALNEARVQRLVTDSQLQETLSAHPHRKGARALRAHLAAELGPKITRSEAESLALTVMRAHGLEPDQSDAQVGPYRVDFLFERERLAVEVDGYRFHSTPKRFVGDRRRTAHLAARNIQIFPLSWNDLVDRPENAMGLLQETLEQRRALFAA